MRAARLPCQPLLQRLEVAVERALGSDLTLEVAGLDLPKPGQHDDRLAELVGERLRRLLRADHRRGVDTVVRGTAQLDGGLLGLLLTLQRQRRTGHRRVDEAAASPSDSPCRTKVMVMSSSGEAETGAAVRPTASTSAARAAGQLLMIDSQPPSHCPGR